MLFELGGLETWLAATFVPTPGLNDMDCWQRADFRHACKTIRK